MGAKRIRGLLIGGTAAVVVAGVAVAALWNPRAVDPPPDNTAEAIGTAELATASDTRVFLGHMSVGWNILSGVEGIYRARQLEGPTLRQVNLDEEVGGIDRGVIAHAEIGVNGDPLGKLANFDKAIRAGLGEQLDVAVLKFCYVDITADTDVEGLFAAYQRTLSALERDYPGVRFLHATAPLTVPPSGIKEHLKTFLGGGDDNPARMRYNALLRSAYDPESVFDLAAVEATAPDGSATAGLYRGYTSDGSHLNESGASLAAAELLRLVAAGAEG